MSIIVCSQGEITDNLRHFVEEKNIWPIWSVSALLVEELAAPNALRQPSFVARPSKGTKQPRLS
jgi:hypothetical protein